METLEALLRRIHTTEDLRSVVRTMKALSAVSIRQYDEAAAAIAQYAHTIELGLQAALRGAPVAPSPAEPVVALLFGSDHGLCGRFNHQLARFATISVERAGLAAPAMRWIAVGSRIRTQIEAEGIHVDEAFAPPSSADGLARLARTLLLRIESMLRPDSPGFSGRALLFHNQRAGRASAAPTRVQLLPVDPHWQAEIAARPWPSRMLPAITMDRAALLTALLGQHLFAVLFRAAAESAASEHATRLAAMQAAERNIEEHLGEIRALHRRRRQDSITAEMLDVVAGFEVLRGQDDQPGP